MKRSEMVKILQNSFIYWMNCPEADFTPHTDEEMYSRVLADLELAGMLPPNTHRCMSHDCEHTQEYKWSKE